MRHTLRNAVRATAIVCAAAGFVRSAHAAASIQLISISNHDIAVMGMPATARPTTGLATVPTNRAVLLQPFDAHATVSATTASWNLLEVPAASALTLGEFSTRLDTASFTPDVEGQYQVSMALDGVANDTIWITAAKYVGIGANGDAGFPACVTCHAGDVPAADWKATRHGTASVDKVEHPAGSHFSESCMPCHSTGYDKDNDVGGLAQTPGWVYPTTAHGAGGTYATNYDSILAVHPAQAKLLNVQCESCHGPGSQHMGATGKNEISASYFEGVCAPCHDEPSYHPEQLAWRTSAHASRAELYGHVDGANCARCHTAQGFVEQNLTGATTFSAITHDQQPVTCAACHDPHNADAPKQLRAGSVATACTNCHKLRISSRGPHRSHQGPMLRGEGGMEFPGFEYPNGSHSEVEGACATCHMAGNPVGVTAKDLVGGHTFRVVGVDNSGATPDTVLNDTGCQPCHGSVDLRFVETSQEKIQKLLDELNAILPVYAGTPPSGMAVGQPIYASYTPTGGSKITITTTESMAAYNWHFVLKEASMGVHNPAYASALLKSSIAAVEASRAQSEIVAIDDVPNDQGKTVQIIWNAFAKQNDATAPITEYVVQLKNGPDWVNVGVPVKPVANQPRYSLFVPTVFDSTASGLVYSVFRVVGLTASSATSYIAAADSGYSIDNLEPSIPTGAKIVAGKLAWDRGAESDIRYYEIFQAELGTTKWSAVPFVTTTDTNVAVNMAVSATYGIRAVDFAGNRSEFSTKDNIVVATNEGRPAPATTALLGNAPNPFNPSTVIRYQLHENAKVTLTVYNVLGQPVRTLFTGAGTVGMHEIVWDGRDNTGHSASSGLYLAVMTTDKGFRAVSRMTLLR